MTATQATGIVVAAALAALLIAMVGWVSWHGTGEGSRADAWGHSALCAACGGQSVSWGSNAGIRTTKTDADPTGM